MTVALPDFQRYQLQFANHIRHPGKNPRPPKVVAKRMKVYTEIVFNNLESSIAACFPVTKKALGARAWKKLIRGFLAGHQSHSPLFRQIPEEFLRYLDSRDLKRLGPQVIDSLPPYLKSLAHYEWVELALAVADVAIDMGTIDGGGNLLDSELVLPPALALLSYEYPVQLISSQFKPALSSVQPVHLLVFRNAEDEVRFIEINQVTARLLAILQAEKITGRRALEKIAAEMQHPDPEVLIGFGKTVLAKLKAQGAILGVRKC